MPAALAIAHALPGRVRLRLPPHARTRQLTDVVSALHGVTACTWSGRTRSLLVHYLPDTTTASDIAERVAAHVGAIAPAGTNGARPGPVIPAMFAELNGRLARATGGRLDLASGIPLALVTWAALELLRGRGGPLAWSTALWYAHGLFRDYNLPPSEG
jgi:hypothetical protein